MKLLNPHFSRSFDLPNNFCQDNQVISNQNVLRGLTLSTFSSSREISSGSLWIYIGCCGRHKGGICYIWRIPRRKSLIEKQENILHSRGVCTRISCFVSKFSIVLYKCTNIYNPSDEYGIKWDDADLNINWGNSYL